MKLKILVVFLLSAITLSGQSLNEEKMDSLFRAIEKHNRGMGSISIMENGSEIYSKAIGYASIKDSLPANTETKYRIGSISKTFTAVMILQLIEEGKIQLHQTVQEFFPDLPNADSITINHLLRHQSGIFNITTEESYSEWMQHPIDQDSLFNKIAGHEPQFKPGEKHSYSNSNYILLTFILEEVENDSYPDILQKRIIQPLELNNTEYGKEITTSGNEAHSYLNMNGWKKSKETDMSVPLGAGGIVSTPRDINTFLTSIFEGDLLKKASVDSLKILESGYGLGIFSIPFDNKTAYGHNGGIDGFSSSAGYFPEDSTAITYISNGTVMPVNDIMVGALSIYYDKEYKIPEFSKSVELSQKELKQYVGVYKSESFPLDITISVKDKTLMARATGQSEFPLQALGSHKFEFPQAGIKMEFKPSEDSMRFTQGGNNVEMHRDKK